ncbi:MAG: hypothetical protein WCO94_15305 [Verrucomicrobiota bacterium]
MDISLINSQSLLRLLALTEKKEELLSLVDNIDAAIIATLKGGVSVELVEIASAPAIAAPALKPVATLKAPATKPAKAKKAKGGKSGGLKEKILALLEAAGDQGLRVKEIAQKLNAKPGNISVWFSTTGKKLVTKVEPGRYAVKGATKSASKPAAAAAPVAVKAAKPVKAKKRKSGLTPEGRAKLAANMKARWAARKAGKPAAKVGKPAKKGFKLPKKS